MKRKTFVLSIFVLSILLCTSCMKEKFVSQGLSMDSTTGNGSTAYMSRGSILIVSIPQLSNEEYKTDFPQFNTSVFEFKSREIVTVASTGAVAEHWNFVALYPGSSTFTFTGNKKLSTNEQVRKIFSCTIIVK